MSKKIIIILYVAIFIVLIFGIVAYLVINDGATNLGMNKYSVTTKVIDSIEVTMKLEDYRRNPIEGKVELKDKELIENILTEIENADEKDSENLKLAFLGIYKVDLGNGTSFIFDMGNDDDGHVELTKGGKTKLVKIDQELLFKIADTAREEYNETLTVADTLKANKIEIYTNTENYIMYNDVTDLEKVDEILDFCKKLELQPMDENMKRSEIAESISVYYEIKLISSYFYIDENFENAILETSYRKRDKEINFFKVLKPENLKQIIPESNSDENFKIIEAKMENNLGEEANLELYVKDGSLSNRGISLLDQMYNTSSQAERYKDNDFIIYKEDNGNWSELPSFAEVDKNIVNKTGNSEIIDWTAKYGELESGVYKLERTLYFGDTRGSIEGEIENKYYVIFEIK